MRRPLPRSRRGFGRHEEEPGLLDVTADLLGAADIWQMSGHRHRPWELEGQRAAMAVLHRSMDAEALHAAIERGRGHNLHSAVQLRFRPSTQRSEHGRSPVDQASNGQASAQCSIVTSDGNRGSTHDHRDRRPPSRPHRVRCRQERRVLRRVARCRRGLPDRRRNRRGEFRPDARFPLFGVVITQGHQQGPILWSSAPDRHFAFGVLYTAIRRRPGKSSALSPRWGR